MKPQKEEQKNVNDLSSEELGLILNEEYSKAIMAQNNIRAITQTLQERKLKVEPKENKK